MGDFLTDYLRSEENNNKSQRSDNNNNRQRENKNRNDNHNKKKQKSLERIYMTNFTNYDRDKIIHILMKENGLKTMIKDIKSARDNKGPRQPYIKMAFKDIIFASAIPEVLYDVFGKKKKCEKLGIDKSDVSIILDEIVYALNNALKNNSCIDAYGKDGVDAMRKAYTTVLYKFNKKKVKKLMDVKNMTEGIAKKIVILTSGGNPRNTLYQLLQYFYRMASGDTSESISLSTKNIKNILNICYDDMDDVVKYIMLEHKRTMLDGIEDVWVNIDELMLKHLERMSKSKLEKVLKFYVNTRRSQERNDTVPRRLGNRLGINPDDYPKLTKVFDEYEEKDFSVIQYFRR